MKKNHIKNASPIADSGDSICLKSNHFAQQIKLSDQNA